MSRHRCEQMFRAVGMRARWGRDSYQTTHKGHKERQARWVDGVQRRDSRASGLGPEEWRAGPQAGRLKAGQVQSSRPQEDNKGAGQRRSWKPQADGLWAGLKGGACLEGDQETKPKAELLCGTGMRVSRAAEHLWRRDMAMTGLATLPLWRMTWIPAMWTELLRRSAGQ